MTLNYTILAVVVLLLPMFYLFLASPAFLLVSLDVPQVAWLLRTQFYGYFMALLVAGTVAALVDALAGHWVQAGVIALIPLVGFLWRRWVMTRLDDLLRQKDEGVAGMAANAAQLAVLIPVIPFLIVGP